MENILVTGDVCVDHHIYKGIRKFPQSDEKLGSVIHSSMGGSFLLYELLCKIFSYIDQSQISVVSGIEKPDIKDISNAKHRYTSWVPRPRQDGGYLWCIDESLGYGIGDPLDSSNLKVTSHNNIIPNFLVIDDADLGFRSNKLLWPEYLKLDRATAIKEPEAILLKMSYPVMEGDLWEKLADQYSDKLILLISAEDLRRSGVLISRGSSWEKSVQDLVVEIHTNSTLSGVKSCAHLIVTFKSEGAFLLSNPGKGNEQAKLIFDPRFLEEQWVAHTKRDVIGYAATTAAGIIRSLMLQPNTGIEVGIELGLVATRNLLENGHGKVDYTSATAKRGFPSEILGRKLYNDDSKSVFSCVQIDTTNVNNNIDWSILGEWAGESLQPLYGVAREVAQHGTKVLKSMPFGKYGKLLTVDRKEIESLNSIRQLVDNYVKRQHSIKPLSIAVFGPPGSGKSFGIKEIIKEIVQNYEMLEYNLSQFETGPKTLISLLHRVRDVVLQGKLPVVFWDEFDSQQLAWLQYLLAPMQDGCFLDGHQIHPLGKCIFVFAGGTAHTMALFSPDKNNLDEYKKFKYKKGPDFVSRLHGYLNVLGPNPRQDGNDKNDPVDIFFPIRRALLLRVMTGVFGDEELKIDPGLLGAFLQIGEYYHGARSLKTIVNQTRKTVRHGFIRSNLPPRQQIEIHVDYDKFCSLITRDMEFQRQSDRLAPVIHYYYSQKFPDGHYSNIPFENLPMDIIDSNIAAALRIPRILALANIQLSQDNADNQLDEDRVTKILEEKLEILAEAEHNGWMENKLLNGWQLGIRDDEHKRHHLLIAYSKLSEKEKDKDRVSVLNFPEIVKQAGFSLVLNKESDPSCR